MNTRACRLGEHNYVYTDIPLTLPAKATQQMLSIIDQWQEIFPRETTYAYRAHGVPCLYLRFDGVWDKQAEVFRPFEIQQGCGWVGYASLTNPEFKTILDTMVRKSWPEFRLLVDKEKESHDDTLWIDRIDLSEVFKSEVLLQIRMSTLNILSVAEREALRSRSIRSIRSHLNKEYGLFLGWWRDVNWITTNQGLDLPWHSAFVLKPNRSHGSKDVMIWLPHTREGRATRTQICAALKTYGYMYLQPFIHPEITTLEGKQYNVIYRPYFGFDPRTKQWIPMHGVWTARPFPNLRIHGASDAISGPLLLN